MLVSPMRPIRTPAMLNQRSQSLDPCRATAWHCRLATTWHQPCLAAPGHRACSSHVPGASKGFKSPVVKQPQDSSRNSSGQHKKQHGEHTPVRIDGTLPKDKAVKEAVEEAKARSRGLGVRPIDPNEAAKGKLDYVQVQDWGSGKQEDLGNLKVAAVSERYGTELDAKPFYEQLARQLELVEARGELKVASGPGDKPLPPFKLWSFSLARYLQFLADASEVHGALEAAVARALGAGASGSAGSVPAITSTTDASVSSTPAPEVDSIRTVHISSTGNTTAAEVASTSGAQGAAGAGAGLGAALAALSHFAASQGLDRHQCLHQDLQTLLDHHAAASTSTGDSSGSKGSLAHPKAGGNARAFAAYLAKQGDRAAGLGTDSEREQEQAALRLFAGAYSVHVSHLAAGVRIGAAATEKLQLFAVGATRAYQEYPNFVADPLKKLVANVNAAGAVLDRAQQQAVFDEVPRVMVKTGMLLEALAHTD